MKAVCLTGNRPQKLPFGESSEQCARLKARMLETIRALADEGYTHFISGMAQGCDIWFAECVLLIMSLSPEISLEAAVPHTGHSDRLSGSARFRYNRILRAASKVTIVSGEYTRYCMDKRNRYMVDCSDVVLAVSYALKGGTKNTIDYAKRTGKRIIFLSDQ